MNDKPTSPPDLAYMSEPWFVLLKTHVERDGQAAIARRMGVTPAMVSMVRLGLGKYGTGKASTKHIAERVLKTLGETICPHLSEVQGHPIRVTSEQCRRSAMDSPSSSPRAIEQWRACQSCPHKPSTQKINPEIKP